MGFINVNFDSHTSPANLTASKSKASMNPQTEITYAEAAHIIGVSERAVRDVLKKFADLCPAKRYGHRSVMFDLSGVLAVRQARREAALAAATRQPRLAPRGKVTR